MGSFDLSEWELHSAEPESLCVGKLNRAVREFRELLYQGALVQQQQAERIRTLEAENARLSGALAYQSAKVTAISRLTGFAFPDPQDSEALELYAERLRIACGSGAARALGAALSRVREVAAGYRHRLNTLVLRSEEYEVVEAAAEDIEDALAETCRNCGIRAVYNSGCGECGAEAPAPEPQPLNALAHCGDGEGYRAEVTRAPQPATGEPERWLIFRRREQIWWRSNRCGYTSDRHQAGRYERAEAEAICRIRIDEQGKPQEEMVLDTPMCPACGLYDGKHADHCRACHAEGRP